MSKVMVQCPGSGRMVFNAGFAKRAPCPNCHRMQDRASNGRIRKHDRVMTIEEKGTMNPLSEGREYRLCLGCGTQIIYPLFLEPLVHKGVVTLAQLGRCLKCNLRHHGGVQADQP